MAWKPLWQDTDVHGFREHPLNPTSPHSDSDVVPIVSKHERPDSLATTPRPRILLVDDDAISRAIVSECLSKAGYRVLEAADGLAGVESALAEKPALVILDWIMPRMNGIEAAAEARRLGSRAAILMLTSRNEVRDRVHGLHAGADDFLAKPFSEDELLARVHALLRRESRTAGTPRRLVFDDLIVELDARTAQRAGSPVSLSKTEFAILDLLAARAGAVVSRDLMLDVVWGYTRLPTTRTIDTHIWRLRRKLNDDGEKPRWIHRIQGSGYLLERSAVNERPGDEQPGAVESRTTRPIT